MNLEGLNPPQREAVEHGDGPLLILAGAGSGKTRVITHRLALLVERGVPSYRILAVTFTNKAAREMRERVGQLLGEETTRRLWIGTFHSLCARLLRMHAAAAGLRPDFMIYDDDDQKKLVGRIMKEFGIAERVTPRQVLSRIDQAKNEGVSPSEFAPGNYQEELVARVYVEYQIRLRAAGCLDFGDLLLEVLRLCDHPEAGPQITGRFSHVLVDEFQDTNRVQYRLIQRMARGPRPNLCVVGDDDQSIYRWRGADVRNILDFERDYPGCKVVKLEQNYRSTEVILEAANGVIARNIARKQKRLYTEIAGGEPVIYFTGSDERREAEFISRAIKQLSAAEGRVPGDFAVLYRMHAQSRALEESLRSLDLPYVIYGGVRFFDRAEVKDLLAYLRVVANPADEISLDRIVNVPPRGIGESTLDRIADHARTRGVSSWEAMRAAVGLGEREGRREPRPSSPSSRSRKSPAGEPLFGIEPGAPSDARAEAVAELLGSGPRKKLLSFVQLIEALGERLREGAGLSELATATLDASGLLDRLQGDKNPEALDRIANLEELLNSIRDYEREADEPSLAGYLERVSLQSATDKEGGGVTLMTVHAAKGLEFPVVFLAGLEEGTFPLLQQGAGLPELEEERRLAYVAITRAKERLVITNAARRRLFGDRPQRLSFETLPLDPDDWGSNRESRFIGDIPTSCVARPVPAQRPMAAPAPLSPPPRRPARQMRDDGSWVDREDEEPPRAQPAAYRAPAPAATKSSERRVEYEDGPESAGGFRLGQRVRHEKFGEGKVQKVSGTGSGLMLLVEFTGLGQKKILARFVEPL